MKKIIGFLLVSCMLCTSAMAFEFELLDKKDIFTPETIESDAVSDWAKEVFYTANELGLVPSLTDNPAFTGTITREQFAELVVNMAEKVLEKELDAAPSDTFSDTTNPSVLKAYQAGIIAGVGNGNFAPKLTTNREQIATMIHRAAQYIAEQTGKNVTPKAGSVEKFTDQGDISNWAAESVGTLVANGIMAGTSAATVSPKDTCTVEQSILMIYRVYQNA